jgi:tRNA(Ile)-lysidine synthase
VRKPPPAAADAAEPLSAAEFAPMLERLGPFERHPRLAAAVSGGPDSMALAFLADGWARRRGGSVLALVVDHGLRPESAAEARLTAGRLGEVGIEARILRWDGPKPGSGIQAAARIARYGLLEAACRAQGILHLLLGHQHEDQAETVAMRAASGSGNAGLAGMAAVSESFGLRRLRPLLEVPKARLIATLRAAGWLWVQDPGNLSPTYARGRLRHDAAFDPQTESATGAGHAIRRRERDDALAAWLAVHAQPHPLGWVRLDREAWSALDPERRRQWLARLLPAVGGGIYPVGRRSADGLAGRIDAAAPDSRWTIGGCIVELRLRHLLVCREPGRVCDRLTLAPGAAAVWDRRYMVEYRRGAVPLDVAGLGSAGLSRLAPETRGRVRAAGLPPAALMALPAFWHAGNLVTCPSLWPYGPCAAAGMEVTATLRPALPLSGTAFDRVNVV